jgi:nucleoside phosphorylase
VTTSTPPHVDILIITVNKHETAAVFDGFKAAIGSDAIPYTCDGRVYRKLGQINGASIFHALTEMGSGGVGGTQQSVDIAIRALKPKSVIAVGIAFGIDSKSQGIGDILVARQLQLYEPQRIGDGKVIARGDKPHATPRLVNAFEGVAQVSWNGAPVRVGLMLSGEKLVDNIDFRESLREIAPEAIGGEMEGAGLYVSSQEHGVHWIVVKAICDWADGKKRHKKTERQKTAATNAVSFVLRTLYEVEWKASAADLPVDSVPKALNPPMPTHDKSIARVADLLEKLSESFGQHHMMMSNYLRYILNKIPSVDEEFESNRLALDKAALESIGPLQIYIPAELRSVINRRRRILSCSWRPPAALYYTLLDTRYIFPRGPIEGAHSIMNALGGAYLDMVYLYMNGVSDRSRYAEVLQVHGLDSSAEKIEMSADEEVACALILEHEYMPSSKLSSALRRYAETDSIE